MHTAARIWRITNVCAFLIALYFAILWLAPGATLNQKMLVVSAAIVFAPPVWDLMGGQTSLLPLCGMAIAGYSMKTSRPHLGGLGLMLALLKPQQVVIFLIYAILRHHFKMLLVGMVLNAAALTAGLALIHDSPASILNAFSTYTAYPANQPTATYSISSYTILAQTLILSPSISILTVASTGIGLLGMWIFAEWRMRPIPG